MMSATSSSEYHKPERRNSDIWFLISGFCHLVRRRRLRIPSAALSRGQMSGIGDQTDRDIASGFIDQRQRLAEI
jgi:hypothetical protein